MYKDIIHDILEFCFVDGSACARQLGISVLSFMVDYASLAHYKAHLASFIPDRAWAHALSSPKSMYESEQGQRGGRPSKAEQIKQSWYAEAYNSSNSADCFLRAPVSEVADRISVSLGVARSTVLEHRPTGVKAPYQWTDLCPLCESERRFKKKILGGFKKRVREFGEPGEPPGSPQREPP